MNPLQTPPAPPFAQQGSSSSASSLRNGVTPDSASTVSLSVNYLPAKFSATMLDPGPRRRRGRPGAGGLAGPKRGGGVEAFRAGEARMGGANDDDYDGVNLNDGWLKKGAQGMATPRKLRWTKFKWILFFANLVLTCYSIVALIFCLLAWFNVFQHADILRAGNKTELIVSTTAASLGIVTAVVGWAGILLNNRMFLAIYTFLLWVVLAFVAAPGYLTYKRRTFNLEGKVNAEWSQQLGSDGRLRIQNQLQCCGYFSPFVEATVSQTCYSRSTLEGCKGPYMEYQRSILERWYTIAFAIVPAHIAIILAGLLCSNHVTYRFGKGMMPKAYRLSMNSMAVIMDNYANQLAEQYGTDVAADIMARSRTNLAQIESLYASFLVSSSRINHS
ncbi:hypothetical protein DL96DRAFT_935463 [Flagelloscypha sp. PMI_526]|nr:hypothetical protein DL96DRAFT_935463 [Flagelloscypha sp. PMI_526]